MTINNAAEIFGNYFISPFLYPFQGSLISVSWNGISAKFETRPWTADKWVVWEIWELNEYCPPLLSSHPVIVDIGAHIGAFSVYISKIHPSGQVLAYEPFPNNFKLLQHNTKINHCVNVTEFPTAIGAKRNHSSVLFVHSNNSGGHSLVSQVGAITLSVPQVTLADVFRLQGLDKIDLLKIDAEGSEFPILLSTPKALLKKIYHITLEYHDYLSSHHHSEIVHFLKSIGFKIRLINYPIVSNIFGLGNILASQDRFLSAP